MDRPLKYSLSILLLVLSSGVASHIVEQTGGTGGPPPRTESQAGPGMRGRVTSGSAVGQPTRLPRNVREVSPGVFDIIDTRPLDVASELLSERLRVSVSYEEAAWVSSKDVMRASEHPNNAFMIGKTLGPLIPRGGLLTVTIPDIGADVRNVIEAVLDNHRRNQNPGEFKLVRLSDQEFSIVADFAEDEKGVIVKQFNPLDVRISLPGEERTLNQTLDLIYQAIGQASIPRRVLIRPLQIDSYAFRTLKVRLGANNDVAREVLAQALRTPGVGKLAWSVRFDPQSKMYGILFR